MSKLTTVAISPRRLQPAIKNTPITILWIFLALVLCHRNALLAQGTASTVCSTVSECNTQAQAVMSHNVLQKTPNTGDAYDAITQYAYAGNDGVSAHSWYTSGDSLLGNINLPVYFTGITPANGFTFIGCFYLTPHSTTTNNTLVTFSASTAGPISVLSFDGKHFILTSILNSATGPNTSSPYAQTLWDPSLYSPDNGGSYAGDGWYMVALTVMPDQRATLDVFAYNDTNPRHFAWFEGLLDAGWPSVYSQAKPQKQPLAAGSQLGASMAGPPFDTFTQKLFSDEGWSTTINPNIGQQNYYALQLFTSPLSRDQVLSWWGKLSATALFNQSGNPLVVDSDLQAGAPNDANVLFPCNSGAFLNPLTAGGQETINTPCESHSVKLLPAVLTSPTSITFPATTIGASSLPQTVTFKNISGSPLTLTGVSLGLDPTEYTIVESTCTSQLPDQGSCQVSVSFNPAIVGWRYGELALADSSPYSPETVQLLGTGQTDVPAQPPSNTVACAAEGGTCNSVAPSTWLMFGEQGSYVLTQTPATGSTNISCTASSFNNYDPLPGLRKACFIVPNPQQLTATLIAGNGGFIQNTGATSSHLSILYGNHIMRDVGVDGTISCNAAKFLWPTEDGSSCYLFAQGNNIPAPPAWPYIPERVETYTCGGEGMSCNAGNQQFPGFVAYGTFGPQVEPSSTDARFLTGLFTAPMTCQASSFPDVQLISPRYNYCVELGSPSDPNLLKQYQCAAENDAKPCSLQPGQWFAYGYPPNFIFAHEIKAKQEYCNNQWLGGDPSPKNKKFCIAYPSSTDLPGGGTPSVSLSSNNLVFVPTSLTASATVSNTGNAPLTISAITIDGSASSKFSETDNCTGSIAPGSSCIITVTFMGKDPTGSTATIQIASNASSSPDTIQLAGFSK